MQYQEYDAVPEYETAFFNGSAITPKPGVKGGRIPGQCGGVKAGHWRWGAADMARAPIGALAISRCRG